MRDDAAAGQPHGGIDEAERQREEQGQPPDGPVAEFQRGGLEADQRIVLLVLVGVDGVIGERPRHATGIEQHGGQRQRTVDRLPAHQRSPVEGQPQHRLRPVGDALHEGIDGNDQQRGGTRCHREPVELQQDDEAEEAEQDEEGEGLLHAHLARRDGAELGALHAAVKVAVGDVVQGAARTPHDDGAEKEEEGIPRVREAAAIGDLAQRQSPPAGQQEKPPADGPLEPHQPRIGP